ncbi:unknown [Choristoneura occidentalis granulovirus]|uniref:Acetyltransferase n=1 Tax=Choristoneura occidentalis granulovirus TaxID=364745 RepID=Q1A4P8_9BBAC|nr:unknown [Choristoneura fumiferana granulovirus]ABC61182.1 unknown [Choristoneura fumiferana granulovirus]
MMNNLSVIMEALVPFGVNNISLKQTHHHYCGFYSLNILASIINNVVIIDNIHYEVSNDTAIDWAFDGEDTIITEKRLLYTNADLPLYATIFNLNHDIVGMVLRGIQTSDGKYCYALQDGFRLYNNHLSNVNLIVREKQKIIAYADRQFDNKQELVDYLNNDEEHKNSGAILYHTNTKNAQLILYKKGLQISNCHLRKTIYAV